MRETKVTCDICGADMPTDTGFRMGGRVELNYVAIMSNDFLPQFVTKDLCVDCLDKLLAHMDCGEEVLRTRGETR